jgi:ABC-type multidrug transport system fused ATPase/permease subunit
MYHGGGGHWGGGPPWAGGPRGGARLHSALDAESEDEFGKVYDSRVIRRLPAYMAWVKKWLAVGGTGTIVRTAASLAMPYLVGVGIDNYIKTKNLNGLNIIALAYLAAALLMWAGQYIETLNLSYAGQGILLRLRTELFEHLHKLSLSFFDHNKVGKIMSRVQNDVDQLQSLLTQDIISIVANALTLIAIAAVMITMNARLALITLSVVPALGIIMVIWQKYARRAFTRVRQAIAVVNDQLQEGISGVRVTQNLSREQMNLKQFDAANRAHLDANVDAARLQAFMMPIVEILTNGAFAIVLVFGGYQILQGQMEVGVLVTFLLYI